MNAWKEQAIQWEAESARLRTLNAELLAALKRLAAISDEVWVRLSDSEAAMLRGAWEVADAAIAKAEQSIP